ncbi:MAG: radical SAM protein, partial [Tissierellales bacterium]|nr:radical SAM protein [Tissierellales bacterium]
MNRKYSKEDYLNIIKKLKAAVPSISISTDFIVGFPGETEEDFEETLDLCREVGFDAAFTFIYSIRPNTPAGKREDQIDEKIKHERFNKLLETLYPVFYEKNLAYKGKVVIFFSPSQLYIYNLFTIIHVPKTSVNVFWKFY